MPATEFQADTEKGFIRLTTLIQVNDTNFLEASQNRAHMLEIKEVSVNYESVLLQLEIGVDEFYHVYPFGNTETYITPGEPIQQIRGINIIDKRSYTRMRSYFTDSPFAKADAQKNYLLVKANNLLLPQFTYLSPYKQYDTAAMQNAVVIKNVVPGDNSIKNATAVSKGDAIAERLILSASGCNG